MSGNIWEWVQDIYGVSYRYADFTDTRNNFVGFHLALPAD